jgi:hypothetical protein
MSRTLAADDRGVSVLVGYALGFGIAALLVTGLVFAGSEVLTTQREQVVTTQMEVVGQETAGELSRVDRLARSTDSFGDITVRVDAPDAVAGTAYSIAVRDVGGPSLYELRFASAAPEESVTVRVRSETPIETGTVVGGGPMRIAYDAVTDRIRLFEAGEHVFEERGGRVVVEAEHPTGLEPGGGQEVDHSWETFEDAAASGGMAVTTSPNVSTGDDTVGHSGDSRTGPRLDYELDFETTGTYYVHVRTRSPGDDGNSDSVHVGLEGGEPASYGGDGIGHGGSNWGWESDVTSDGSRVTVQVTDPGRKTLHIWMREDGTQLDKVVLTRDDSYSPSGTGPGETR